MLGALDLVDEHGTPPAAPPMSTCQTLWVSNAPEQKGQESSTCVFALFFLRWCSSMFFIALDFVVQSSSVKGCIEGFVWTKVMSVSFPDMVAGVLSLKVKVSCTRMFEHEVRLRSLAVHEVMRYQVISRDLQIDAQSEWATWSYISCVHIS